MISPRWASLHKDDDGAVYSLLGQMVASPRKAQRPVNGSPWVDFGEALRVPCVCLGDVTGTGSALWPL